MEAKTSYLTFTHTCFWCNIICIYICKYVYQIIVLQQQLFHIQLWDESLSGIAPFPEFPLLCSFCRNLQPRCQRHGWCPSSAIANDCSSSNPTSSCTYWWAHPAEPMEPATAGAASPHSQTGTEQERNGGEKKFVWKKCLKVFVICVMMVWLNIL